MAARFLLASITLSLLGLSGASARADTLPCWLPSARPPIHVPGPCDRAVPAAEALPPELTYYIHLGCNLALEHPERPSVDADDRRGRCQELTAILNSISPCATQTAAEDEEVKWQEFKANFRDPCAPIPAKYFKAENPHRLELLKLISPRVVFDPSDTSPPVSAQSLAGFFDSHEPGRQRTRDEYLASDDRVTRDQCHGTFQNGRCCGSVTGRPVQVDAPPADDQGHQTVYFGTIHRKGYMFDERGEHIFDSEAAKFEYAPAGNGLISLTAITFSRHVHAARQEVCRQHSSLNGSSIDDGFPGHTTGPHPVFFQARGGHSFYLGPESGYQTADTSLAIDSTTSAPQRAADQTLGTPQEVGSYIRPLYDAYIRADHLQSDQPTCVSVIDDGALECTGSLWNDPVCGANRNGFFNRHANAGGDYCLRDESRVRSVRYTHLGVNLDDSASLAAESCRAANERDSEQVQSPAPAQK